MTLEKASGKYLCSFCAAKEKVNAKNPHLGKCRDCDEWVSIGAVRCPNCGADLRVRI
jgi:transcription elongation factor Elf1